MVDFGTEMSARKPFASRPSDVAFVDKYCSPMAFPDERDANQASKARDSKTKRGSKASKKRTLPDFLSSLISMDEVEQKEDNDRINDRACFESKVKMVDHVDL